MLHNMLEHQVEWTYCKTPNFIENNTNFRSKETIQLKLCSLSSLFSEQPTEYKYY